MSGTGHSPLEAAILRDGAIESVEPAEISAALDAESAATRQRGARACTLLAETDVDSVRPFVAELGRALADENPGVVQSAASALVETATADVDAVTGVVSDVAVPIQSDLGGVQLAAAQLLRAVASEEPSHCVPVADALLDRLGRPPAADSDEQSATVAIDDRVTRRTVRQHEQEERQHERVARQIFADVAVAVAEAEPPAFADRVETLAELVAGDDVVARGAGLDILGSLCRDDPATVEAAEDAVVACLDADAPVLRARAVRTLGFLGDGEYAAVLRECAAAESDDEIAAFAAETAAFLDE
ncbi:hypothetical protein [Haloarcula onubensis]|uniref:HEAT repeat domain-containing protein n=1 Tax=Haloarcula onubensis TaxID=2950539 RepID=A0ABU2FRE4_9EURY|nr:hypothetical protein [Halomicroarcula sp. S3CR25-11]MDS0282726.1 hypothetical protein [Halomicroarcula sp. S3CR25-11]